MNKQATAAADPRRLAAMAGADYLALARRIRRRIAEALRKP